MAFKNFILSDHFSLTVNVRDVPQRRFEMRKVAIWCLVLTYAILAYGCLETSVNHGDNEDDQTDKNPMLGEMFSSGCKHQAVAKLKENNDTEEQEANTENNKPENDKALAVNPIEANAKDGVVTITHHDAEYQCDSEVIFTLQAKNDTLVLTEVPKVDVVTDCKCLMDLRVDLLNLVKGQIYHIEVWNQYHTVLFGTVDVKLGDCPEEFQCETGKDCYNKELPHDDCEGVWTCNFGKCDFVCKTNCQDDSDCPDGFSCIRYDTPLPLPPCCCSVFAHFASLPMSQSVRLDCVLTSFFRSFILLLSVLSVVVSLPTQVFSHLL